MNVEQAEIYIRTKQVFHHRFRKDEPIKPVEIKNTEIAEAVIIRLLDLKRIVKIDFSNTCLYGCLYGGFTDFNLLPKRCIANDNLTISMLNHLNNVSIDTNVSAWFNTFQKLKDKRIDLFVKFDTFSGRFHTPITSIRSDLRRSLLLYGKSVASVDIIQAQPTILAYLLLKEIGVNQFSSWILNNEDVYLIIQTKCRLSSRSEAKEMFYKIVYGLPNDSLVKLFGNANWIDWINKFKTIIIKENSRSQEKPHTNLSWRLQTIEVYFMKLVWSDLNALNIPFLTVHDEIIVREFEVLKTLEIMHRRLVNYLPTIQFSIKHSAYVDEIKNVLLNIKSMDLIEDNLLDLVYDQPIKYQNELRQIYCKMDQLGYKEFHDKY